MSDPSTSGFAGATGESEEEKKLRDEASEIERQAKQQKEEADSQARKNESEESGVDDKDRAIFLECCIGVRNNDPVWLAKTPETARAALRKPGVQEKVCK
jgi:hypothetical protein